MNRCVFAGTFDPFTKGHEYIVKQALRLFDEVVVAVGVNPEKKPFFSLEQRLQLISIALKDFDKVKITSFDGLLVDFMKKNEITVSVRGVRDGQDYQYEKKMADFNKSVYPDMLTIFISAEKNYTEINSSIVRDCINQNIPLDKYLSNQVYDKITEFLQEIQKR